MKTNIQDDKEAQDREQAEIFRRTALYQMLDRAIKDLEQSLDLLKMHRNLNRYNIGGN